jgi:prefoldin subunit 5
MQFAWRAYVDDTLALNLAFIQRRLNEIAKETENLRRQLHEVQARQHEQLTVVAQTLLQEVHDNLT